MTYVKTYAACSIEARDGYLLIAALVIIVISLISAPSFEKCGAMASKSERIVCYEQLRDELLKSPAK